MDHRPEPRARHQAVLALALLGASAAAFAAGPAAPAARPVAAPAAAPRPRAGAQIEGISEHFLDNGLRVLLFPDRSASTVTVNITYFVGSRHEGYGESGMAHLLEHLLFKGTPTHKNPWALFEAHGAQFNGTTWFDRTNYYETMPATPENLDFALKLEADRMVHSRVAKEDLDKEFSVVRNEFELGENQPEAVLEERMYSTAYLWHNYGRSTIGSKSDIERVPIVNLRAFYQRYYQPDNAMLVVAGKFDPQRTLGLIQAYFGPIPRPQRQLPQTYTVEPAQDGERLVTLRRTGDVAMVGVMYHGVPGAAEDFVAEQALIDLLVEKPAGRLYKALVESKMAASVSGEAYPLYQPGMLQCFAKVRLDRPVEPVRDRMIQVLEGLVKDQVTDAEVARFRARALKRIELALTDSRRIGVELSEWAALGDWRLIFIHRDRVKALRTADVRTFAATYLKRSNRTVGLFLPEKAPERSPLAATPDVAAMVKGYRGQEAMSQGEDFQATIETIEKRTRREALRNGMKVALLQKKTRGGAVLMTFALHFGSEADLKGRTAVGALLPAMLLRGTRKHTYQQLRDELDRLRAEVIFGSEGSHEAGLLPGQDRGRRLAPGANSALLQVKTVRESVPEVLALIAEVLQQPSFPAAEFETVKKEAIARLEEQLQDPIQQALRTLKRRLAPFGKDDVRYEPSVQESIERLGKVRLADVVAFYRGLVGGSHAELVVIGDFELEQVRGLLEKHLGGWRSPKPYARIVTPHQAVPAADEVLRTPDKQMAIVAVGLPIEVRDDDPDYPALQLANHVLGGAAKSRIFDRLRQKEGLSYGAFSNINGDPFDRRGVFFAGAICAPQNAGKAMELMVEEIGRLLKDGVPEDELKEAKRSYQLAFDNQLGSDTFVALHLMEGLHVGRTLEYYRKLNARVQALSGAEVIGVLRRHVDQARLIRIRAGDLKEPPGAPGR